MVSTKVIVIIVVVAAVAAILALSVVPYPGHWNASVTVGSEELSVVIGTYWQITSVHSAQTGQSTVLDWSTLGFTLFQTEGQFKMVATLSNGQTSSLSGTQLFPSIPVLNGGTFSATNTLKFSQVPTGTYDVSVVLYDNGANVASGSTTMTVGG